MYQVDREPKHLRNTYNTEEELYKVVGDLAKHYWQVAPEIEEYEEFDCADAETVIVAHGVVTRAAQGAVKELREQGKKVGHFRPITLRPFPKKAMEKAIQKAKEILVVESAEGQLAKIVKAEIYGSDIPITGYFRPGMGITAEEIVEYILNKG